MSDLTTTELAYEWGCFVERAQGAIDPSYGNLFGMLRGDPEGASEARRIVATELLRLLRRMRHSIHEDMDDDLREAMEQAVTASDQGIFSALRPRGEADGA